MILNRNLENLPNSTGEVFTYITGAPVISAYNVALLIQGGRRTTLLCLTVKTLVRENEENPPVYERKNPTPQYEG